MKDEETLDSHALFIIHLMLSSIMRELNKSIVACQATFTILEEKGIVTREEIDKTLEEEHDKIIKSVKEVEAALAKKYGKNMNEFEKLIASNSNIVGDA